MRNPFQTEFWRRFYAKHRGKLRIAGGVALFGFGFLVAWWLFGAAAERASSEVNGNGQAASDSGTGSPHAMHSAAKTPRGLRTLSVSREARALMNVETARVEKKYVTHTTRMVGRVDYDETRLGYITAWVAGRLDRMYVSPEI